MPDATTRQSHADNHQYQVFQFAFYTLANVFLKASLAITFNRILLEKWQRLTVQVVVGINTAFGLAFFFVMLFRCGDPMNFYARYNHSMCVPWEAMQGLQYTDSVINTLASWTLAILPIFALRAMKMNQQAKISAGFILVLGCVSSIMSMPRFGFLHALGGTGGQFWTMAYPVAVLGVAEVGTGATAACLLTLRPLIRSWRERSEHSPSVSSNHKDGDEEKAEVGQARAVSLKSVSAISVQSSTHDSMHKVKSIPATIVIETAEVKPASAQLSTATETMKARRRSSVKPTMLASAPTSADATLVPEKPQAPPLVHRMTQDSDVRPWRPAAASSAPKVKDSATKRLTWNDMHAQWNNFHSARTACHGPVAAATAAAAAEKDKAAAAAKEGEEKVAEKPRRISLKRVSGILREWSWDKALSGAPPMPGSNA